MRRDTIELLERQLAEFPRSFGGAVTLSEIHAAAKELGYSFPADYAEFLERYGGAEVGPYPIYGLRKALCMGNAFSVVEITKEFRLHNLPGNPNWIIISEDHAGNYVGIAEDGKIYCWDHDLGEVLKIAESFEDYLHKECLA